MTLEIERNLFNPQVYIASMIAMMAGADFIKTSTGKEAVNATLPVGLVMIRAIQSHFRKTGKKVGVAYQLEFHWQFV